MIILIIFLYAGTGVSAHSVEFTSMDKCMAAAKIVQQDKDFGVDTYCVEK